MELDSAALESSQSSSPQIKPMNFWCSLLYFGIPALVFVFAFRIVMPALIRGGMEPFYAFCIPMGIPLALMAAASIIAFRMEGRALSWAALKERFRLFPLGAKLWLLTIGAAVVTLIVYGIAIRLNLVLMDSGIISVPSSLPAWLDTSGGMPDMAAMDEAFGGLAGNWMAFAAYFVFLAANIIGEEFWWRGYILPRQELAFGQWAWLIHGLMWAFFHAFKYWDILGILPLTLIISFLVCRYRNTSIAIVIHTVVNGMGLIPILLGILGVTVEGA